MTNRNLRKRDNLRLLPEFVSKVEDRKDRDVDVRRNECLIVPVALDENRVPTSQQEDNERDQGEPSSVRLEWCLPRKFRAIDSLCLATVVEAQINSGDDHPAQQISTIKT